MLFCNPERDRGVLVEQRVVNPGSSQTLAQVLLDVADRAHAGLGRAQERLEVAPIERKRSRVERIRVTFESSGGRVSGSSAVS